MKKKKNSPHLKIEGEMREREIEQLNGEDTDKPWLTTLKPSVSVFRSEHWYCECESSSEVRCINNQPHTHS